MATKTRLSVYLDPELMDALAHYADRRDRSRSLVAEAAIASFLSPDADSQREAAVTKRLDRIDRRLDRLERDHGIGIETLALFVRFWLTTTPQLPEQARSAARLAGNARYDQFLEALGRRLARGEKLRLEIAEDLGGGSDAEDDRVG
jgi:predicted transcriptional regulator